MFSPHPDRRRRARGGPGVGGAAALAALAALSSVAVSCSSDPPPPPPPPITVQVVHDGATTPVRIRSGRTVGDALEKAKVEGTEGQVLAAESKKALGPNGNESTLLIDSIEANPAEVLTEDTTIEVLDGEDTTEPTEVVTREEAVAGLPKALQHVHAAGKPGVEEVTVGTKSDEVVSRRTITPGVPAHRATGKVLALTFDDGPHPEYTPKILDILKQKKVVATFCTIGTQVEQHPELVRRIVDEGHQLCNHTMTHAEGLEAEPRETIEAEMGQGRQVLVDAAGVAPPYYRPPGGSLGPPIYEVAGQQGEAVLYWSIDPRDWKRPPAGDIVKTVIDALGPGGIILLHDGGGVRDTTIEALPGIIDQARQQGYTFTAPISGRPQVG